MKKKTPDFAKRYRVGQYVVVGRDETPRHPHELPYVDPHLFESGYYESAEDYIRCMAEEVLVPMAPNDDAQPDPEIEPAPSALPAAPLLPSPTPKAPKKQPVVTLTFSFRKSNGMYGFKCLDTDLIFGDSPTREELAQHATDVATLMLDYWPETEWNIQVRRKLAANEFQITVPVGRVKSRETKDEKVRQRLAEKQQREAELNARRMASPFPEDRMTVAEEEEMYRDIWRQFNERRAAARAAQTSAEE